MAALAVCSADWEEAFLNEIRGLISLGVFTPAKLPKYMRRVPTKWVMTVKANPDGTIDKFKVRFVGKGFRQRPGHDYDVNSISAPVAHDLTHKIGLATKRNVRVPTTI